MSRTVEHILYPFEPYLTSKCWWRCALLITAFFPTLLWAIPHNDIDPGNIVERVVNYRSAILAKQREQFLAAEKALRLHRYNEFQRILPTLTEYPLYPYLQYQSLKSRLRKASSEELSNFFEQYPDIPVTKRLRHKLLRDLARKGRWKDFLAFYVPTKNTRQQCNQLYALIQTGQTDAAYPGIEKLWLQGRSQPRNCDRVFRHWKKAGKLTTELVWERIALALDNGKRTLARYLVRSLPNEERKLARMWIKLHRKPQLLSRYQKRITRNPHPMASRLFVNVAKRLAQRDPHEAAKIWLNPEIKRAATEAEQFDVLQKMATALAQKQQPGAETWFSIIPEQYLNDTAREWRVRAALRQAQWAVALDALDSLTADQQRSDRWRYWRARVNEELGRGETAKEHFSALAQRRSFWGFLAADRIDQPYAIANRPHITSAGTLFKIGQQAAVQRARELVRLERWVDARREWRMATREMTNDERVDAAKLAQLWGWAEQSILTMASTDQRDDLGLRFPLLYQQQVMHQAKREEINPAWIYGVIRRESAFMEDARSPVGAVGLMQLMPATAKSISRTMPKKYRGQNKLVQADINLALGTRYLRKMLKRFSGQTVLATAAYNAGAHRIMRWLPEKNNLEADRWIENIPFKETREYVTSVLAFTVIYADRLGVKHPRLSQHLTTVPTRETL